MKESTSSLFSPVKVGPYELPNRMVMSPMTRCRAGEGGVPTSLMAQYYEQRSSTGLIITEAAQVSLTGVGYPYTPGIHNDEQADGWKAVTGAVHRRGGRIFCQLFHAGRVSVPQLQPENALPVAPSAVAPRGEAWTPRGMVPFGEPRALGIEEIEQVTESYRRAAEFAVAAGFDGVELHAANGYLPDQFLQDGTNRRDDEYGGPPANRIRFVMETLDRIVGVWGSDRVGVHISPGNPFNSMSDADPDSLFSCLVEALAPLGLAYLHVSEIKLGDPGDHTGGNFKGWPNEVTRKLRRIFGGPYITNGGYDGRTGQAVLKDGDADLVAFGRLCISNPDLPERLRRGAELNPLDAEKLYVGAEKGYTDYPSL